MSRIKTPYSVNDELRAQGYSVLRAAALEIPDDLQQALLSLTIDYADLPSDEYLPGGGKYRCRRYGRFRFLPASGELQRLPHVDYFQSADINRVTGRYLRKFSPLSESSFDNPFLQELIHFDFDQFPVTAEHKEAAWEVQIHLIRVTASAGQEGHPTPEGIHRDGAEFVTVHLAELVNAGGGDVSIYDDDKTLLTTFRLQQVMDSYLFHDALLLHQASPISPENLAHPAIRSILTFDYHLAPDSGYSTALPPA